MVGDEAGIQLGKHTMQCWVLVSYPEPDLVTLYILAAWSMWIQDAKPDHWPMRSQQARAWGYAQSSGQSPEGSRNIYHLPK